MISIRYLLLPLGPILLAACGRSAAPAVQTAMPMPFVTTASIRELMSAEVDPAADALWNSVTQSLDAHGEKDRQPRTDEEWDAARHSAITLIEATNLLMMDGRHIAPAGIHTASWELDPTIAQHRLETHREEFAGFAAVLRNAGLQALEAIDARDGPRLFDAGTDIEEACEACHLVYWYPPAGGVR
jgi:hypothetical protein